MKSTLLFFGLLLIGNVSSAGFLQCHFIKPSSYMVGHTIQSPDGSYRLVHPTPDGVQLKARLTPGEATEQTSVPSADQAASQSVSQANNENSQSLLHIELSDPHSGLTKSVSGMVKDNEPLETSDFAASNGQVYQAKCTFSH